ncbi:flagellar assembly protein FliW [Paenibacillus methanolicus]|uniref:Flagellar assembly factor FliW n=1 Tax=Paenibacillus methanolicus TaxID=582686 RepID=A0A5S5C8J8_9BACL|nr:flagellar assembly protein FliW [Paenibacillus methanolicus]TYP75725.1 flagellar assembly factor FliW [Paenibacillus methanolicus]
MESTRLGDIKVTGSEKVVFNQGLPGFEELRNFAILDLEIELPIKLLQSEEESSLSLLIGNPFHFYPEYEWDMPEHAQQELRIEQPEDVEVWSVIILPANAAEATINLLAPIVMNKKTREAKQIILHNSAYSNRHPLLKAPSHEEREG